MGALTNRISISLRKPLRRLFPLLRQPDTTRRSSGLFQHLASRLNASTEELIPTPASPTRIQKGCPISTITLVAENHFFLAERATDDAIVFVHNDAWVDDYHPATRIVEGLQCFEVIGVAGNRKRMAGKPSWNFIDTALTWDDLQNLSDAIAHGDDPFREVSYYGPRPAEFEFLDGVLLAVRTASISQANLRFDPIFRFHFYDLDFCRQARQAGLRVGDLAHLASPIRAVVSSAQRHGMKAIATVYESGVKPQRRSESGL